MSYFNDDVFKEFEEMQKRLLKHMREAMDRGDLKGDWEFTPIEEPDARGYVAKGRFYSGGQPPLAPLAPTMPKQPRDLLADIVEDEASVKVYVELPGVNKEDIQLDAAEGELEVKAANLYKRVALPEYADIDKATSRYNNGVLEVTFPKVKSDKPRRRISLE